MQPPPTLEDGPLFSEVNVDPCQVAQPEARHLQSNYLVNNTGAK